MKDIFFEHDLGSTEFEVLEYNKKEIIYTYSNSSNTVRKKVFSLDTNILTLPAFDNQGNQISIEAICNQSNLNSMIKHHRNPSLEKNCDLMVFLYLNINQYFYKNL